MTVSQSVSVILNSMLSRVTPALLISTVGGPSSAAIRSTAASTCVGVADVGAHGQRPATGGLDRLDGALGRRLVQVEHGDGEPVLRPAGGRSRRRCRGPRRSRWPRGPLVASLMDVSSLTSGACVAHRRPTPYGRA